MFIRGKHWWDIEEMEYIRKLRKEENSYSKIAKLMSIKFNQPYTKSQISSVMRRYIDKGINPPVEGFRNYNYLPIGTEKEITGGYINVKVGNGEWELKHRIKYKEYNGSIPEGYVVIFANGNRKDFSKDNLIAISRNTLKIMNSHNLIKEDSEVTKTGTIIAEIIVKTQELKKNL